jgi:hypothetical protein
MDVPRIQPLTQHEAEINRMELQAELAARELVIASDTIALLQARNSVLEREIVVLTLSARHDTRS